MSFLDSLLKGKSPEIKILQTINTESYPWCNCAIMFEVKNGKSALKHICSDIDRDYCWKSHLTLNGLPILQSDEPYCPTCSAVLAAGYGIENINCAELDEVRKNINSDFRDIETSFEILKPLLGLLEDGVYLLADVPHYSTNGDGKFFYDISNEPTSYKAACMDYYFSELLTPVSSFPAYLYPTQSDKCINKERVEYYVDLLKNSKNPPRAIAYHEVGFISALLDGHHKAIAAAALGLPINCLTIIKGFNCSHISPNGTVEKLHFSAIVIPNDIGYYHKTDKKNSRVDIDFEKYNLIHNVPLDFTPKTEEYPTVEELTNIYAAHLENTEITDELIDGWFSKRDEKSMLYLKYVLIHLRFTDKPRAYQLAKRIVSDGSYGLPKEVFKVLLKDKSEETENLFIDYIVNHSPGDECWDIANSYWE